MTDSKDYFNSLEPKATPRVELLALNLAELHRAILAMSPYKDLLRLVAHQQRIEPRL